MVRRRKCGKAPEFRRDRKGPSKHGEALSATPLPALSMTRTQTDHDHFRMQVQKWQKVSQEEKPLLAPICPPSPGPWNIITTSCKDSISHHQPEDQLLAKMPTLFIHPHIQLEYLLRARNRGLKNKGHTQDLCPPRAPAVSPLKRK